MEEVRGTEALEQEILDDARKRADRIVRKAEEDAKALQAQTDQKIKDAVDALKREYEAKKDHARQDVSSRVPLERMRLEIEYRDTMLRDALRQALASMDSRLFGRWCLYQLRREIELVRNSKAKVAIHGLDAVTAKEMKELFSDTPAVTVVEDSSMSLRGVFVKPADDSYHVSITEDELMAWLLDEKRGELGAALFGSTL